MDRLRDRRYDRDRGYGGESYRPSDNSRAPYRDGYQSPPRRRVTPPPSQRYVPVSDSRRPRSPPYEGRGDASSRRPLSPSRRGYSPHRGGRSRSPPVRSRRYSRSPLRTRSPPRSRRQTPPYDRNLRSPGSRQRPPASPRDRYDERPKSPIRDSRPRFREEALYRPRPRSRSPLARQSDQNSRPQSTGSSRRSSPPIHPDRLAQAHARPRSPANREVRSVGQHRSEARFEVSPLPRTTHSPRPRSPGQDKVLHRSPAPAGPREPSAPPRGPRYNPSSVPPPPLAATRADDAQMPPSQLQSAQDGTPREPPSGPAAGRAAMSSQSKSGTGSILAAPTRPRGGPPFRGDLRESSYGGPSAPRGGRSFAPPPSSHSSRQGPDASSPVSDRLPSGPRSGPAGPSSSRFEYGQQGPPFRNSTSSSTTYPRTQRFTNHLASLPNSIEGGKALPPVDPAAAKKLSQLEDDANRLRKQIDEKQKLKRAELREWETRERESRREGMRSECAERQLESFSGEMIGGQAF